MAVSIIMWINLNNSYLLQCRKSTILLDSLEPFHRDINDDGLPEFWHIQTPSLEIRLPADLACGVELRRASAVRISPADLRALPGYVAGACHSRRMVA